MMASFPDILKDLMVERNLNQVQIAKILDVRQSQISEWLSGKRVPGFENLRKIAIKLDVSGDFILGLEE